MIFFSPSIQQQMLENMEAQTLNLEELSVCYSGTLL